MSRFLEEEAGIKCFIFHNIYEDFDEKNKNGDTENYALSFGLKGVSLHIVDYQ